MEQIAEERLKVCQGGCEFYDELGESDKLFVKGQPGCVSCGCVVQIKVRCLSCECGAVESGLPAKWGAIMSQHEEDMFRNKSGITNE